MPPTSRRATRATTPARSRATERAKRGRRSSPAAPRPGPRAGWACSDSSCRVGPMAVSCRRWRSWTCAVARPGRARFTPAPSEALAEVREANAKAIVLLNRRGWSPFVCCRACGHAFQCRQCEVSLVLHSRERAPSVPSLRPRRAHLRLVPRVRLGRPRSLRRRHRAPGHAARRGGGAPAGLPPRLGQRRRRGRPPGDPEPLSPGRGGRSGGHPDGRQGPRLPRCDAERGAGRGRDASLPRLPRRGAHLRARRPARRAQRARRARWAGAGPDPRAGGRGDPPRGRPRRPGVSRRRAGAAPGASLSALLAPDPDRADVGRGRAAPRRRPSGFAARWRVACRPAPSSWGRRPASGSGAATAVSSCSRPSAERMR